MVSRVVLLKSVPRRSRNWTVSNAEKHRNLLRAERCKRIAPTARFPNRHRYQMLREQINGANPTRWRKKTIRPDVMFLSFSRVRHSRRDVTANIGESSPRRYILNSQKAR